MIYSRATRYAIQALVYLASNPDEYHTAQEIAEEREIPEHFLAKILKDLVKEGMLESRKGRGGGFKLALPPEEIMLLKVVESVEGLDPIYSCIFGIDKCSENDPCPLHNKWGEVRDQIVDFLEESKIADLVEK